MKKFNWHVNYSVFSLLFLLFANFVFCNRVITHQSFLNPQTSRPDSTKSIEIIGVVTHKRNQLSGSALFVYQDDRLLLEKKLGEKGRFIIQLPLEHLFRVEVAHPDFHSKVFKLATHT